MNETGSYFIPKTLNWRGNSNVTFDKTKLTCIENLFPESLIRPKYPPTSFSHITKISRILKLGKQE